MKGRTTYSFMDSNSNLRWKWIAANWHGNVDKIFKARMDGAILRAVVHAMFELHCGSMKYCANCCRRIAFYSCIIACNNFNVFSSLSTFKSLMQFHNYKTIQEQDNKRAIAVNKMFRLWKQRLLNTFSEKTIQSLNGNLEGVLASIWITYDKCFVQRYQTRSEVGGCANQHNVMLLS